MNREEFKYKNLVELIDKMSEDDKISFYESSVNGDFNKANILAKKYGYTYITYIGDLFDKGLSDSIAKLNLKIFDKIKKEFEKKSEKDSVRECKIPIDSYKDLIEEARSRENYFNSGNLSMQIYDAFLGEDISILMRSAVIMDIIGCMHLKKYLTELSSKMAFDIVFANIAMAQAKKDIISKDRSNAKKGKTNRHHDSALKIAMYTWGEYPNASLAGMTEEIHAHLRSKWNDAPTAETIKSWLKKSNLYPDAKPKNRDFKLVINEEG
ncbi:hypothetical protein R3P88_002000 [Salmonella enterica]|nr:hypothetical protein [Salmonella enterica]ECC9262062.1 hypothetical protein [Salmonella enterica subsp. diarizonae]ECW9808036.1 hypothetical protein [Salmonella enterica subsp. enterica serovar Poona]EAU6879142.1 hypothetical protein [Salmonella enterica]ECC9369539.1 hypothetical protein [Salmonella enterica subsp. diarizonae]